MKYFNTLSTPSGKNCSLYEITNEEYLVLVKFFQSGNVEMFYKSLDEIIEKSISDFQEYNIVDKVYVYIAFIFFSIKPSITIMNKKIGDEEILLNDVLDNIEKQYSDKKIEVQINDKITAICSYPKTFYFDGEDTVIDYLTSIEQLKFSDTIIDIDKEQRTKLIEKLPTKDQILITDAIREQLSFEVVLSENPLVSTSQKLNLLSPNIFSVIAQMYMMNLEDFYNQMYIMQQYIRFSRRDFLDMTPFEAHLIINNFIKDKQEQAEEQKTNK